MKRSSLLLAVAVLLALTSAFAAIVYVFAAPTPLRIAVGPAGGEDTRLVVAVMQTFAREKHPVRLRLLPTEGPSSSAEALANEKADLAVVRSDGNVPPNAATVAILHRDVVMLLATPASGVKDLDDLAGKRVGIVRGYILNQKLFGFILERSGVAPASVTLSSLRSQDVRAAVQEGKVDAVLVVAPPTGSLASAVYNDLVTADGRYPVLVPIDDAEAIAQRNPLLESVPVLRGAFGGARPPENVPSIAVTHRLVADRKIKESLVADLTKSLFEVRQAISVDAPMGARIEQPNLEAPGPLVVHPGAASYFEGEQRTFIEQYGEWIYIAVMAVSLMGSLGAAMMSRMIEGGRPPKGRSDIDRMLLILRRARLATAISALDDLQKEADDSLARMVERAASAEIDETVMSAFAIALGEVRTAIEERRRALSEEHVAALAE